MLPRATTRADAARAAGRRRADAGDPAPHRPVGAGRAHGVRLRRAHHPPRLRRAAGGRRHAHGGGDGRGRRARRRLRVAGAQRRGAGPLRAPRGRGERRGRRRRDRGSISATPRTRAPRWTPTWSWRSPTPSWRCRGRARPAPSAARSSTASWTWRCAAPRASSRPSGRPSAGDEAPARDPQRRQGARDPADPRGPPARDVVSLDEAHVGWTLGRGTDRGVRLVPRERPRQGRVLREADRAADGRRRLGPRGALARRAAGRALEAVRAERGRLSGKALDAANNAELLRRLLGAPTPRRRASYVCVAVLVRRTGAAPEAFTGRCWGYVLEAPGAAGGFGYDPLFYFEGLGKTFGEAADEEKHAREPPGRRVPATGGRAGRRAAARSDIRLAVGGGRAARRPSLASASVVWRHGAWRRPVARLVWDQEVAGSSPAAPTRLGIRAHVPTRRWGVLSSPSDARSNRRPTIWVTAVDRSARERYLVGTDSALVHQLP